MANRYPLILNAAAGQLQELPTGDSLDLGGESILGVKLGSQGVPSISFTGDTNTGIYSPGADQLAISTNGVERVKFGTTATEVVFNDTGVNYDFRIEGDTVDNVFFVDASTDRVGLGTSNPGAVLESKTALVQIGDAAYAKKAVITNIPYGTLNITSSAVAIYDGTIHAADIGYSYDGTGYYLTFGTNEDLIGAPIERLRIDRSGRLLVGTATQVGNVNGGILQLGSGITFPATPVAASDPNTLDDYEEGTWLPSIGGTATYSNQDGRYVKIGSIVHVTCRFTVNQIGTGSTAILSGLPFPSANLGTVQAAYVSYYSGIASSITWISGYVENSASTMQFTGNSTAATTIQSNGLVIFQNGANIIFSASYYSA
jgi:hypothetical protein